MEGPWLTEVRYTTSTGGAATKSFSSVTECPIAQRIFSGYFFTLRGGGGVLLCKVIFRNPPKIPFKTSTKLSFPRLFSPHEVILSCKVKGFKQKNRKDAEGYHHKHSL